MDAGAVPAPGSVQSRPARPHLLARRLRILAQWQRTLAQRLRTLAQRLRISRQDWVPADHWWTRAAEAQTQSVLTDLVLR